MLWGWDAVVFGTSSAALFCLVVWLISRTRTERALMTLHHLSWMGQREIARSYPECLRIVGAAGGAGLITAGTVVLKFGILGSPLPLLESGMLVTLNFVLSFLIMQVFDFRLATKQSSLLGANLGRRFMELRGGLNRQQAIARRWRVGRLTHQAMNDRWQRSVQRIARLTHRWWEEVRWSLRTQLFSALGNLAFVIPAAFVFHWVYLGATGAPFLDPAAARAALASLHPAESGSLGYAALTGGVLWVCTFFGGMLGQGSRRFSKAAATLAFNICLGVMLAFIPVVGRALDLPLDVRHFTLSGGTVAVSVASLGFGEALRSDLLAAFAGVLAIGVMNFSISFALGFVASLAGGAWRRTLRLRLPARAAVVPVGLRVQLQP